MTTSKTSAAQPGAHSDTRPDTPAGAGARPGKTAGYRASALRAVEIERDAIDALSGRIDDHFERACEVIMDCQGRVVVTGMGKSGHIGNKIAATLASTGTPSFFVHPGEASHGDLGMITGQDVVLAISNSGNTSEVLTILPLIKRMGAPLISMTGNPASVLAREAVANLDVSVAQEACPLGLAPTSSTTATLVMGDALAVSAPRSSRVPTPGAALAVACCCGWPTSCTPATASPGSTRTRPSAVPCWKFPARAWA